MMLLVKTQCFKVHHGVMVELDTSTVHLQQRVLLKVVLVANVVALEVVELDCMVVEGEVVILADKGEGVVEAKSDQIEKMPY